MHTNSTAYSVLNELNVKHIILMYTLSTHKNDHFKVLFMEITADKLIS